MCRKTSYIPKGGFNKPFYQWESNLGYCGESSLIQAAMSLGQWISQYNARTLNSSFPPSISQTGVAEGKSPAKNFAEVLLDDSPQQGENVFSSAASNFGLVATDFDSTNQKTGQAGYQQFMQWIKAELSAGNRVTIGVVTDNSGGAYSHIVSVVRFDVNDPSSSSYDPDDVLYFDDHGLITSSNNPAVPLGSSSSPKGCTPFIFGNKLSSWPLKIASGGSKNYAIPLPTNDYKNYGTSISGIKDIKSEAFPVSLTFTTSNPKNPICDYQYEAPFIGSSDTGSSVTNVAPKTQIMNMTALVSNLTIGNQYNFFTYKWTARPLPSGPLQIPTSDFNSNSDQASSVFSFTASSSTFETSFLINSSDTIVIRVVLADSSAPVNPFPSPDYGPASSSAGVTAHDPPSLPPPAVIRYPVTYKAACTGAAVVSPVTSKATGLASVTLRNSTYATGYFLVSGIQQMTMAQIHTGAVGQNGPVVIWAFNGTYGLISGSVKATFTFNPTLNNVSSLLAAGLAYFNIDTTAYPAGELRGQLTVR